MIRVVIVVILFVLSSCNDNYKNQNQIGSWSLLFKNENKILDENILLIPTNQKKISSLKYSELLKNSFSDGFLNNINFNDYTNYGLKGWLNFGTDKTNQTKFILNGNFNKLKLISLKKGKNYEIKIKQGINVDYKKIIISIKFEDDRLKNSNEYFVINLIKNNDFIKINKLNTADDFKIDINKNLKLIILLSKINLDIKILEKNWLCSSLIHQFYDKKGLNLDRKLLTKKYNFYLEAPDLGLVYKHLPKKEIDVKKMQLSFLDVSDSETISNKLSKVINKKDINTRNIQNFINKKFNDSDEGNIQIEIGFSDEEVFQPYSIEIEKNDFLKDIGLDVRYFKGNSKDNLNDVELLFPQNYKFVNQLNLVNNDDVKYFSETLAKNLGKISKGEEFYHVELFSVNDKSHFYTFETNKSSNLLILIALSDNYFESSFDNKKCNYGIGFDYDIYYYNDKEEKVFYNENDIILANTQYFIKISSLFEKLSLKYKIYLNLF